MENRLSFGVKFCTVAIFEKGVNFHNIIPSFSKNISERRFIGQFH
jgi:hypothetical protein